jgi:hypothetical protein
MKGLNFLTNDKGERIALQIDLKNPDKVLIEYLEDLEDLIDIKLYEKRKDKDLMDFDKFTDELKQEEII